MASASVPNPTFEPSSVARQAAKALFDMHMALIQEGFTEVQALQIIGHVLRGSIGGSEK